MMSVTRSFISLLLIFNSTIAFAFETDQFNLPPTPLFDIGDDVSDYVSENINEAVAELNAEISKRSACLAASVERSNGCGSAESERKALVFLRSDEAIARQVFKQLGDGIFPLSHVGNWLTYHRFRGKPSTYKTSYQDSIYILSPTNYITISPTIRMYGSEFGIDKIEHFFQQGYSYFKIYKRSIASGLSTEDSTRRAIRWGQMTERTYFGSLVSGVFSNADLFANYAGLKFYIGLTQPTAIAGVIRPPLLKLTNGFWEINNDAHVSRSVLQPFISDHLNEAFNPSGLNIFLFPSVKKIVKNHSCPQWQKTYSTMTDNDFESRSQALRSWNGEDYGFTQKRRMVSVGQICLADAK